MEQFDVTCFTCGGRGSIWIHAFVGHAGESSAHDLRCQTCDGIGTVPAWLLARHMEGARRRSLRIAALLTQREMAVRLAVPVADYSKMEYGTLPWPEGSERVFTALEAEK